MNLAERPYHNRAAALFAQICLGLLILFAAGCATVPRHPDPADPSADTAIQYLRADGIERLIRLDHEVYRGGSPTDDGLRALAREQVKTIISFQKEVPYAELAAKLGLRVVHLPLSVFTPPTGNEVLRFLDVVTDPAARPVFIHCRRGKDRTGAMSALYRMQVQGWPVDRAVTEMLRIGFDRKFASLYNFVTAYPQDRAASVTTPDQIILDQLQEGQRLLDADQALTALDVFQAVLLKHPALIAAHAGRARAMQQAGAPVEALEQLRHAMIVATSEADRVNVARLVIEMAFEAQALAEMPPYGYEIMRREWAVLRLHAAEDSQSLLRLGHIFQEGLYLALALEAMQRARGQLPETEIVLEHQISRIRGVRAHAPRSDTGKRLGLMETINRGELATLLIHELKVDRLRPMPATATWRDAQVISRTARGASDIEKTPHRDDIERVLALGIRGLERFPDHRFQPLAVVSRAEFALIFEDLLTRGLRDTTLPTRYLAQDYPFVDVDDGAWYQSAASLTSRLGLFAPAPDAPPQFKPMQPVTGVEVLQAFRLLHQRLDRRERAVVVVVDGLRAESLYMALDDGRLPHLQRLLRQQGVLRFDNCLAALPSVTLPNQTTIFTGVYPNRHGITGNEWFDRDLPEDQPFFQRRREYIKFGTEADPGLGRAWAFGGRPLHGNDMSSDVRTVFEAFHTAEASRGRSGSTAVVFNPVRRGADIIINPSYIDALVSLDFLPFINAYSWLDRSAMRSAVALLESDDPPELLSIWLPGMDGWSHANGPGPSGTAGDRQATYMEKYIDPLMADLTAVLEARGLLDETLILFVSDHGQSEAGGGRDHAIDVEQVYRTLAQSPYRVPLDSAGRLDINATAFDVVVMANSNGNAALVSVRAPGDTWQVAPAAADLQQLAELLLAEPYIARVVVPEVSTNHNEDVFQIWDKADDLITPRRIDTSDGNRMARRLQGLMGTSRSGNILIETVYPYFFAPAGSIYLGQHGRAEHTEDHVPLLIINPPEKRYLRVDASVKIVDVAPTLAGSLGFYEVLPSDGQDLLAPPEISISSHAEDQVVPAEKPFSILGFTHNSVGAAQVEWRVGAEGAFHPASGSDFWEVRLQLPAGRHPVFIRATATTGMQSVVRFYLRAEEG